MHSFLVFFSGLSENKACGAQILFEPFISFYNHKRNLLTPEAILRGLKAEREVSGVLEEDHSLWVALLAHVQAGLSREKKRQMREWV